MITPSRSASLRGGFTLVEVLVALAIVGLLIGLTAAGVVRAREAASRLACANNLRQLATGVHAYAGAHGHLPVGCQIASGTQPPDSRYYPGISWLTGILPYVEQDALFHAASAAHREDPFGLTAPHHTVMSAQLAVLGCPSTDRVQGRNSRGLTWGVTTYLGASGTGVKAEDGIFHRQLTLTFASITDGTSSTLMIGERPPGPGGYYSGWYANWGSSVCFLAQIMPAADNRWLPSSARNCAQPVGFFRQGKVNDSCELNHFWSLHPGGANFAFADGSVRFLRYASAPIMPALATRAGGELVSLPD